MKAKFQYPERDRRWQRINYCVLLLLAGLFGGALVYLGFLFFKMP
jgi:hypothetical protein